jgi:hypothetical protein
MINGPVFVSGHHHALCARSKAEHSWPAAMEVRMLVAEVYSYLITDAGIVAVIYSGHVKNYFNFEFGYFSPRPVTGPSRRHVTLGEVSL